MSGWAPVTLGDLGNWGSGGTPKKGTAGYYDGSIPWLKIGDLTDGLVDAAEDHITEKALAESSAKLVEPGTLLVAMYGSIGKLGIAGFRCATNQAIAHCRVDERLTSTRFLFWRLLAARSDLLSLGQGAGQPNISQTILRAFAVDLPPLAEQGRIVAKLDAIFEQTRAAKARLERPPTLLEKLKRSILAAAFRGDLTKDWRAAHPDVEPATLLLDRIRGERRRRSDDGQRAKRKVPSEATYDQPAPVDTDALPPLPASWVWARLPDFGEVARGRSRHRPRNEPALFGDRVPFIQTGEVARSGGRITTWATMYSDFGVAQSRVFPEGTVCITIAANIAESGVLYFDACFPDSVVGVSVDVRLAPPTFVEFFIRVARGDLARFAPATAQANINLEILGDVAVPLPPRPETEEIVRILTEADVAIEAIMKRAGHALERLNRVEQAALAKAFRGELVPRDPADEPASVLLDRIRAARATTSEQPKRGRGHRSALTTAGSGHATHDRSIDLVAGMLQIDRRLTATAIANGTGLGTSTVEKALKVLVAAGQVRVEGKARSVAYVWTT